VYLYVPNINDDEYCWCTSNESVLWIEKLELSEEEEKDQATKTFVSRLKIRDKGASNIIKPKPFTD
jgi:hypothetical protein